MALSGIYGIIDADTCAARHLDPLRVAEAFFEAELPIVQFRAKGVPDRTTLDVLGRMVRSQRRRSSLVFANDRADLATLAGCDGVHLGQEDLPVNAVAEAFPRLSLGLSTHSEAELASALKERLSYVALGPIFDTTSKKNPEPTVGLTQLVRVSERPSAAGIPLVVIGGIDEARLPAVAPYASAVAMIGSLLPSEEVADPYAWIRERGRVLGAIYAAARV